MDNIVKILAAKYNLDTEIVERVIRSEFEFVKETMEAGEFQSVRLQYLGCFAAKENRVLRLTDFEAWKALGKSRASKYKSDKLESNEETNNSN